MLRLRIGGRFIEVTSKKGRLADTFKGLCVHKSHFGSQSQFYTWGFPWFNLTTTFFLAHGRKPDQIRKFHLAAVCTWRRNSLDGGL